MYWTARETETRGMPSCSNCMKAMVPVASCSRVWSTFSAIGVPGFSSPSARCSFRIWVVSESGIRRDYGGPMAYAPPARHLLRAKDLADRWYFEPLTVDELSKAAGLSRAHFSREFRRAFGESPHAYLLTR